MSSLRERLLRQMKPSAASSDLASTAAEVKAAADGIPAKYEGRAEPNHGTLAASCELGAVEPQPDEWHSISAAAAGPWGEFIMRRRIYKAEYIHGHYQLGSLREAADVLLAMLAPGAAAMDQAQERPPHERLLFVDTETTGLGHGAGNIPFMIGIGYYEDELFLVEQMLMRHPGEEASMLSYLQEKLKTRPVVISYNGKSFDWPIIRNRYIMNRLLLTAEPQAHIDFLYPSRSLWKHTLASCRLGQVEEDRLGVRREGDVPGSQAPALYFQYLAERDPVVLQGVFEHNELDVLSLAGLAIHFAWLLSGKTDWRDIRQFGQEEWLRLGLWLDKIGLSDAADQALDALSEELRGALDDTDPADTSAGEASRSDEGEDGLSGRGRLLLAQYFKRRGRLTQAVALWERCIARQAGRLAGELEPYIELSMYYEHKAKNAAAALRYALEAAELLDSQAALRRTGGGLGRKEASPPEAAALVKRIARLRRKAEAVVAPQPRSGGDRLGEHLQTGASGRPLGPRQMHAAGAEMQEQLALGFDADA